MRGDLRQLGFVFMQLFTTKAIMESQQDLTTWISSNLAEELWPLKDLMARVIKSLTSEKAFDPKVTLESIFLEIKASLSVLEHVVDEKTEHSANIRKLKSSNTLAIQNEELLYEKRAVQKSKTLSSISVTYYNPENDNTWRQLFEIDDFAY